MVKFGSISQQPLQMRLCLVDPAERAERGDQRLVGRGEFRVGRDDAPADADRLLVVALEHVGDRIDGLEEAGVRVERRKLAVALKPLQRRLPVADIAWVSALNAQA